MLGRLDSLPMASLPGGTKSANLDQSPVLKGYLHSLAAGGLISVALFLLHSITGATYSATILASRTMCAQCHTVRHYLIVISPLNLCRE